jgi:uncharacterized membrane protein YdjX (TVP38/TMEM64 family)
MSDRASYPVSSRRFAPLCVLFVAGVLFLAFGGHRYLTLAALAENRNWMCALVKRAEAPAALGFILAYAGLVALSVPGAALLTITGGFLFGPWLGGSYAVVGATIGATIVFLAARAGLSGLAARASPWMRRVDDGFRANGLSYLLVLRLIPVIPFWLVNLVAAAAGLRLSVYIVGTFIGMIPVTLVYASLGNGFGALIEQGQQPDLAILFRPNVLLPLLGLAALALAPVLYQRWRTRGR